MLNMNKAKIMDINYDKKGKTKNIKNTLNRNMETK